jgi:RNA polymerase sigma-70 factor (ECF subfamily)
MKSDWDYLTAARKGDHKAFEYIYRKYSSSLLAITSLITGSIDSGKDTVQETFMRIMKANISHQEGNFKSYITTIAYRLALKEKSRTAKFRDVDGYDIADEADTQPINDLMKDYQREIFSAISSLPEQQKKILILRFYGELSYESIAGIENLPLGTVKSRIFYAVKACREKLKAKGIVE